MLDAPGAKLNKSCLIQDDMSLEVPPSPVKSALKQKRLQQFPPQPSKEKRHLPGLRDWAEQIETPVLCLKRSQ